MKCPCDGCVPPKRHLHCHSTCPDYKDFRDWKDQIKQNRRKILDEENFYNAVTHKRFLKR
jgi:hypothetical protein